MTTPEEVANLLNSMGQGKPSEYTGLGSPPPNPAMDISSVLNLEALSEPFKQYIRYLQDRGVSPISPATIFLSQVLMNQAAIMAELRVLQEDRDNAPAPKATQQGNHKKRKATRKSRHSRTSLG